MLWERLGLSRVGLVRCPFHDDTHPSLAIYPDHVFCFGCGVYVRADEFLKRHPLPRRREVRCVQETGLPSEGVVQGWHERLLFDDPGAYQYITQERGICHECLVRARLGHTGLAYSIPVYDRSGALVTVRFRRDDRLGQERPKYWGVAGHNRSVLYLPPDQGREVLLCEGEFDALRARCDGFNACSFTNGVWGWCADQVRGYPWVYVAFDQDPPGSLAADRLVRELVTASRVTWKRTKDVSDLLNTQGREYLEYRCRVSRIQVR